MKTTLKITVMLLVAMFAFSPPADAQFGSLNALRKQMGIKTKKENKAYPDMHTRHRWLGQIRYNDHGQITIVLLLSWIQS